MPLYSTTQQKTFSEPAINKRRRYLEPLTVLIAKIRLKKSASQTSHILASRNSHAQMFVQLFFLLVASRYAAAATPYSPYATEDYPRQLLWGDTHLHTSLSLDAAIFGARLTPADAYRFAMGEIVTSTHAGPAKLSRPLDFLVVADHSDGLGAMNEIIAGNSALLSNPTLKSWHEELAQGGEAAKLAGMKIILSFTRQDAPAVLSEDAFVRPIWEDYLQTADQFNQPGEFTALIGYEWTSTEGGNNLHRNVIFRGNGKAAATMLPYTTLKSSNPEDLWLWMAKYEEASGSQVLAIPHNGNLSNGLMFPVERNPATQELLDNDYIQQRTRWEPLYEVVQTKGDSESHPFLSPSDEFAGFDHLWDKANLFLVPKQQNMLQYEYAREVLKNGLKLGRQFGENPYKIGLIGSTDIHTALATAEESNFFGKHARLEPSADRWKQVFAQNGEVRILGWELVAAGYAAVWAKKNTRAAIFDAMMRREVYATTGPRIVVRLFGGWNFSSSDVDSSEFERIGYARGVPMGGDLSAPEKDGAPTFMAVAMKDPESGNLDRLQIIKGWLDAQGNTHEKVYDAVWSNQEKRIPGTDGKIPDVGNTVDIDKTNWSNSIGATTLRTLWQDPDFDPEQSAFYYARVIEIPTPRWTAYDAQRFDVTMDSEVPMTVRERAYTSPIWYTP
jgi:hypothetical protein